MIIKNMFLEIVSQKNLEAAYLDIVAKFAQDSKEASYHGLDNIKLFDHELDSKELLTLIKQELIELAPVEPALLLRIPKKNNPSKNREIFIYNLKERIKAEAIYRVVLPIFEKHFSYRLFSYRPNKPPYLASYLFARRYRRYFKEDSAIILDLSNYSTLINRDILVKKLEPLFKDEKVMGLLKLFIFNKIYDNGVVKFLDRGIVQGVPLIALFANLYLTDLDFKYDREVAFYIRVGDDLALADPDLEKLKKIHPRIIKELEDRGLEINKDKAFIGPAYEKFNFLGYSFNNGVISLEDGFIRRIELEWKELLKYKHNSAKKKDLIIKRIMDRPNYNFNNQFQRIVKEKAQVNNVEQVKKLSEKFFRILTEFFYERYTDRNRRLLSKKLKNFDIFSLYSYYKNFHYERGRKK